MRFFRQGGDGRFGRRGGGFVFGVVRFCRTVFRFFRRQPLAGGFGAGGGFLFAFGRIAAGDVGKDLV